jgi:hypothetical protein
MVLRWYLATSERASSEKTKLAKQPGKTRFARAPTHHGGLNVFSITVHLGGKITKSAVAVPGVAGFLAVKTV